MADIAFKRVFFDTSSDPVRAEFHWWEELDDLEPTTFSVWVKSRADVDRNALLATECIPGGRPVSFVLDLASARRLDCGAVLETSPGRLIVEFPRSVLADYGPDISWWGLASVGESDADTYVDPDSSHRNLSA